MMDHTTIAGAAGPCPTVNGSLFWSFADTLPGAIASAEPDIRFLTLADLVPEGATMAEAHPRRRRRAPMPQAFAEAYAESICQRLSFALVHVHALRVALREAPR
jgi:hypothetical protein